MITGCGYTRGDRSSPHCQLYRSLSNLQIHYSQFTAIKAKMYVQFLSSFLPFPLFFLPSFPALFSFLPLSLSPFLPLSLPYK